MKESSRRLLDKAGRAIEAAETLLVNGYPEFATGLAYYAMFYIAEALLNEKELQLWINNLCQRSRVVYDQAVYTQRQQYAHGQWTLYGAKPGVHQPPILVRLAYHPRVEQHHLAHRADGFGVGWPYIRQAQLPQPVQRADDQIWIGF